MSPECVCEVLSQNTPQIIFYNLLNLPLFGSEPKCIVRICVCSFKGKWAGAPHPLFRRGWRVELQELMLWHNGNNKTGQSHALKMSENFSSGVQPYMFEMESDSEGVKQAEIMVAFATLALQSTKKLFQKSNLEKVWLLYSLVHPKTQHL